MNTEDVDSMAGGGESQPDPSHPQSYYKLLYDTPAGIESGEPVECPVSAILLFFKVSVKVLLKYCLQSNSTYY